MELIEVQSGESTSIRAAFLEQQVTWPLLQVGFMRHLAAMSVGALLLLVVTVAWYLGHLVCARHGDEVLARKMPLVSCFFLEIVSTVSIFCSCCR